MPKPSRSQLAASRGFELTVHAEGVAPKVDLTPLAPPSKYAYDALFDMFKEFLLTQVTHDEKAVKNATSWGSSRPSPTTIKDFLRWYCMSAEGKIDAKNTAVSLNTAETQWYRFRTMVQRQMGCEFTKAFSQDILGFIRGRLKSDIGLVCKMKSKSFADGADIRILLQQVWCEEVRPMPERENCSLPRDRVQESLLMLMHLYTAARPGAMLPTQHYPRLHLQYKISLELAVRSKSRFTDDLIGFFLALAFQDQAFQDFATPLDLMEWLEKNFHAEKARIRYKAEKLEEHVLKQTSNRAKTNLLDYNKFCRSLHQLSINAGYAKGIAPYDIRRAVADTINRFGTTAQQNQTLGHYDQKVYKKCYQMALSSLDLQRLTTGALEDEDEWDDAIQLLRRIERRVNQKILPPHVRNMLIADLPCLPLHEDDVERRPAVQAYLQRIRKNLGNTTNVDDVTSRLSKFVLQKSTIPASVEKLGPLNEKTTLPLIQTFFTPSLRAIQKYFDSDQPYSRKECLENLLTYMAKGNRGCYRPNAQPISI
ncbi:MAG: hypothetical protein Q9162_006313 [Coniocarpon cinnabarinum]